MVTVGLNHHIVRRSKTGTLLLLTTLGLSGCVVGPDFTPPLTELAGADISPNEEYAVTFHPLASSQDWQWWLTFNDPVLNQLESRTLTENLDLKRAGSRILQSRALLGITDSDHFPQLSASTNYRREGLSQNGKFVALGAPSQASSFWQLGVDASWELDLWGHSQRISEGATAALRAAIFENEVIQVSLAAEVAKTYFLLRRAQIQLGITQHNLSIAQRLLNLTQSRQKHGVGTRFETTTAASQLASIKAALPQLQQQRNTLMNALALLMGEKPRTLNTLLSTPVSIPVLPDKIPTQIPSNFVQKRPDILKAQAELHRAVASIGAAKADFYPRITLTGNLGVEGYDSQDLTRWDSRVFSVGPHIYLPIFEGGRLKRQLELSEARQKSAAITYRQTVLNAWHEVDNAVDNWAAQQVQHRQLVLVHDLNQQALESVEHEYKEGVASYLNVLTAQRNILHSETELNDSATQAILSVVTLYKSLGGGWNQTAMQTDRSPAKHRDNLPAAEGLL